MLIERKSNLSLEEFKKEYLEANNPVIITDAMHDWDIMKCWTFSYINDYFGDEEVQLYDDLFNLIDIIALREYIIQYCNKPTSSEIIPYIRWYARMKDCDFVWADDIFAKIKTQWQLPYFLPNKNYLLPYSSSRIISPVDHNFPAKGIFISAKGAKTKLHYDPWCSDAVLCQICGTKNIVLYSPEQKNYLYNGCEFVNIEQPDFQLFPDFSKITPTYVDTLVPGEIVFFPHNWFHQVKTMSDSISLTWNFVHITTWKDFFQFLTSNAPVHDLEVINFFLQNS